MSSCIVILEGCVIFVHVSMDCIVACMYRTGRVIQVFEYPGYGLLYLHCKTGGVIQEESLCMLVLDVACMCTLG